MGYGKSTVERGELVQARAAARRAQTVLRDLTRALALVEELERPDIVGRLVIPEGRPLDLKTIRTFLGHCRRAQPNQDLTIVVLGAQALSSDDPANEQTNHE
jgi:hypothetical protein